ncbi:carbohydrate porin [Sphingomonas adhaesiva]|uniref:carbohydrate porin n=1 Tax=Sphingomonas adhaesiva TaxID=28212 RepID=UPI002FF93FEB
MPRSVKLASMLGWGATALLAPGAVAAQQAERPVVFDLRYKADVLAVAAGGVRHGVRYLDNLDATMAVDLDRVAGVPKTQAFVYLLYNNGTSFSSTLAGDAQIVSSIETGVQAVRLYEAWVEHGDARLSARAGLYDVNSEFDALTASMLFVHSGHGTGTDISQTGNNGPSIFPVTAPGLRVQGMAGERVTLRAAVLGGTPGNPAHPGRTVVTLRPRDGVFAIAEADWRIGHARLIAGTWRYTARFALHTADDARAPARGGGNAGVYLRGEARVAGSAARPVSAFFRLGTAAGRFNLFDRFASIGINAQGVAAPGGQDELGFAIAHARTAGAARAVARDVADSETVFELTYRTPLTAHLSIQPDLQYVVDPSASRRQRDVLVVGVRFEMTLRR